MNLRQYHFLLVLFNTLSKEMFKQGKFNASFINSELSIIFAFKELEILSKTVLHTDVGIYDFMDYVQFNWIVFKTLSINGITTKMTKDCLQLSTLCCEVLTPPDEFQESEAYFNLNLN